MNKAINEYQITGVETTLDFCKYAINHEVFKDSSFDTNFVKNYFTDPSVLDNHNEEEEKVAAIFAALEFENQKKAPTLAGGKGKVSQWKTNRSQLN